MGKSGRIRSFVKLRRLYKKTKGQMASILGVPVAEIEAWENNEKPCPDYIIELIKLRIDNNY